MISTSHPLFTELSLPSGFTLASVLHSIAGPVIVTVILTALLEFGLTHIARVACVTLAPIHISALVQHHTLPWGIGLLQRVTGLLLRVTVLLQRVTVLLQRVTVLLQRVTVLLQRVTVLLQRVTVLSQRDFTRVFRRIQTESFMYEV
jgi:hypothetical protein